MNLNRVLWLANRLASMSGLEIVHRVRERRMRGTGRAMGGWDAYDVQAFDLVPFAIDQDTIGKLVEHCGDDWRAIFEQSLGGTWHFLGRDWPGVAGSDAWHLDPVSGANWPQDSYCFDIDFRHGVGLGDVKYVWELNRLQFLPPIAALARGEGDAAAAQFCIDTILSWADANPPFKGVNWASGIELALRAISIILTLSILGTGRLSEAQERRIGMVLNAHAVWLERYPSLFSSANNHLVAEAAALYLLGLMVPSLPAAARYRDHGRQILVTEVEKQILSDGVGAEQTPTYTAFTLELYALAIAAARDAGDELPPVVHEQLSKAGEFLRWITDDSGYLPRFGDDDEGRAIISHLGSEERYVASILNGVVALSGRSSFASPVALPHLRDAVFGAATPVLAGPRGLRSFDAGGYSVFRADIEGREALLVFDHGPLGYLSIAAHGHADALAVWLHVDGQPVIVDAGTYLYHSGGAVRDHFRGTAAHNTLEINGANQSTIVGAFNWSHRARAWRVTDVGGLSVTARHDGYRQRFGVVHQRQVRQEGYGFTISDTLSGPLTAITNTVSRLYLDPSITAQRDARGAVALSRNGTVLMHLTFETATGDALAPDITPTEISPRFGVKLPCAAITLTMPPSTWRHGAEVVTRMRVVGLQDGSEMVR